MSYPCPKSFRSHLGRRHGHRQRQLQPGQVCSIDGGCGGGVTPRRVRLRRKAPVCSAAKVPSASETPAASAEKFVLSLSQPWLLRELVKYLGAEGLLRIENLSQSTVRGVVGVEAPSLWRALATAAGVTVNHSECETRGLKTVCRIAEAFSGESWTLDSFEEKERFIRRGQLALALARASLGPGLRVSFRLDAWQSHRLKGFIRDLLERRYSGEEYEFLNSYFLERDEFRADAAVELQVALFLKDSECKGGQVRRLVTIRGVVSLTLSWEKRVVPGRLPERYLGPDGKLRLRAAVSLHADSAALEAVPCYRSSVSYGLRDRLRELCKQDFLLFPVDLGFEERYRGIFMRWESVQDFVSFFRRLFSRGF